MEIATCTYEFVTFYSNLGHPIVTPQAPIPADYATYVSYRKTSISTDKLLCCLKGPSNIVGVQLMAGNKPVVSPVLLPTYYL